MIIGYARCSTEQQDVEGQIATLKAAGTEKVFAEKISGTVTDRKALAKAVASLNDGDVLLGCLRHWRMKLFRYVIAFIFFISSLRFATHVP